MKKEEKDSLSIEALLNKINDILYWEPDYEQTGIQPRPDESKIIDYVVKVLTINPKFDNFPKKKEFTKILKKYGKKNTTIKNYLSKNNSPTWKMRDGKIIKIKDMKDSHLANTILMLIRKNITYGEDFNNLIEEYNRRPFKNKDIDYFLDENYEDTDDWDYDENIHGWDGF